MRPIILLLIICTIVPYSFGYVVRYFHVKNKGVITYSFTREKDVSYDELKEKGLNYQADKRNYAKYTIKKSVTVDTNRFKIVTKYDTLNTEYWVSSK